MKVWILYHEYDGGGSPFRSGGVFATEEALLSFADENEIEIGDGFWYEDVEVQS